MHFAAWCVFSVIYIERRYITLAVTLAVIHTKFAVVVVAALFSSNIMSITKNELQQMLSELKMDINNNTSSLITSVKADINNSIESSISSLERSLDAKLSTVIAEVKDDINLVNKRCESLESKVERLERLSLLPNLILNGVPFIPNEDLMKVYNSICSVVLFENAVYTLQAIFRVGKSSASKYASIVMKFISVDARNKFYSCYLKFKNLSVRHIGFEADLRIFIQESLTKTNAEIFRRSMELKRDNKIVRVHTHNGLVFVKVDDKANKVCCVNLVQLSELVNSAVHLNHKRKPSGDSDGNRRQDDGIKYFKHTASTDKSISILNAPVIHARKEGSIPNHAAFVRQSSLARSSSTPPPSATINDFFSRIGSDANGKNAVNID